MSIGRLAAAIFSWQAKHLLINKTTHGTVTLTARMQKCSCRLQPGHYAS